MRNQLNILELQKMGKNKIKCRFIFVDFTQIADIILAICFFLENLILQGLKGVLMANEEQIFDHSQKKQKYFEFHYFDKD